MRGILALALALCLAPIAAQAQSADKYPERSIKIVVPFPPGGSVDVLGRLIAQRMQENWGQSVIVETRPGASTMIGTASVAKAEPDGYTLIIVVSNHTTNPALQPKMQYDALKDFDLITVAVQAPNVLVVPAASPFKSVADVIAALKAKPDSVSFASSGNGSSDHLTAALFWQQTGTQGLHVPYKGGGPVMTDLLGGQVQASFQNLNAVVEQVKAGKLRALAITSAKRSPLLPDVPTLAEAGVKGVDVYSWQALVAPKGLPADVRKSLHAATVAALNDPQIRERFTALGFEVIANTPEQFADFQQKEFARWKKVIETGKITAD